jgi:outer membrane protein TolC
MYRRLFKYVWLLAALGTCAHAAKTNAPPALTLADCLDESVRQQPDIAAAREAVQRAEFQYRAALSAFLPQLSASAGASRLGGPVNGPSNENNFVTTLQVEESLYTGGHDTALLAQRGYERDMARGQLVLTLAQFSYNVRSAFIQQLYNAALISLSTEIVKRRSGNVDLVSLRYDGGREHKGSLLRMQAILSQAQFDVQSAQRAFSVARQRLAVALGRDAPVPAVQGKLEGAPLASLPNYERLAAAVPDVLIAQAQAKAFHEGVRVARSEYLPTVSAIANVTRNDDVFFPQENGWMVGVQINYPFFPGGRNIQDVHSAQSDERRYALLLRSQWQQALVNLKQAFNDWQDAVELLRVQREFLQAAELRAEISRNQYAQGLLTFDNWDIIENDLITQQRAELAAQRDAVLAEAAWEKARGVSLLPVK